MRWRTTAAALATAALLPAAGCGSDSETERELRESIAARTGSDVEFVECPTAEDVKTGQTFRCKALVAVDVTQTDNNGNLRWTITNLSGAPGISGLKGPTGPTGTTGGPTTPSAVPGATGATGAGGVLSPREQARARRRAERLAKRALRRQRRQERSGGSDPQQPATPQPNPF